MLQMFAVASLARSISLRFCFAALIAGMSASAVFVLIVEQNLIAILATTAREQTKLVRVGAYCQDPVIEEFGKLLPLILVMIIPHVRRALCLTDIVVLASALGAGFAFMESALSLGTLFSKAETVATLQDGFFIVRGGGGGLERVAVPAPWITITAWLPNGFTMREAMGELQIMRNPHVIYSIFAGTGLAVILKAPRLWWIWVPAVAYSVLDHIGHNAEVARFDLPLGLSPILAAIRPIDGVLAAVALITVILIDRARFENVLSANPSIKIASDGQNGRTRGLRLAIANIRNRSALKLLWQFLLTCRSYVAALSGGEQGEAHASSGVQLRSFAASLRNDGTQASPIEMDASSAEDAKPSAGQRALRYLLLIAAIIVATPPLVYGALVGFMSAEQLAQIFAGPMAAKALLGTLVLGVIVQAATGLIHARHLLKSRIASAGLWHGISAIAAFGGIALAILTLSVSIGRDPLASIGTAHAIGQWLYAHPLAAQILGDTVAVLNVLVPLAVGIFLPQVAFGIGVVEALTGRSLLTGERLSFLERTLGLIPGFKVGKVFKGKEIIENTSRQATGEFAKVAAQGAGVGKTVLGHYPEYKQLADTIRARRFSIPEAAWNQMSPAEQWATNQKFLDQMIIRGDDIILATPLDKVRPGSFFARELKYLASKGYRPNADGTKLIGQ